MKKQNNSLESKNRQKKSPIFLRREFIGYILILFAIPITLLLSATVFNDRQYAFITIVITFFACIPFFLRFEQKEGNGKLLIIIAVMVAMSAVGRFIFAAIPHFKPVTALVVLTALYFGAEAGFVTGALAAVLSNFYFGQGPWTPFQMFAWGMIGLLAGLLAKPLLKSKILLISYGVFAGIVYSLLLDVWITLWQDGFFNLSRYIAYAISAIPVTIVYIISNVVFLLIFLRPVGTILDRIKYKYGL